MTVDDKYKAVPQSMRERDQWVVWRAELRHRDKEAGPNNKKTKVPYNAAHAAVGALVKASSNDRNTWSSYDSALRALAADHSLSGIGYCFSEEDGLVGIDLDHCFNQDHDLHSWAQEIVDEFAGAYIEISPSGDGLHIWCAGKAVRAGRRRVISKVPGAEQAIEIYDYTSPRYFTVTGAQYQAA